MAVSTRAQDEMSKKKPAFEEEERQPYDPGYWSDADSIFDSILDTAPDINYRLEQIRQHVIAAQHHQDEALRLIEQMALEMGGGDE